MGSQIPIFGLPHRIDVKREEPVYDSYGGVSPNKQVHLVKVRCRISHMTDKDEQEAFGNASGKHWTVVVKGVPDIRESDFISLNSASRPAPIDAGKDYRVMYVKKQSDHTGRFHHTTVVMELEDASNF